MPKDLTSSHIDRQNILNNELAIVEIQNKSNFKGIENFFGNVWKFNEGLKKLSIGLGNQVKIGTYNITKTNDYSNYAGIDFTDANATFMIRADGLNGVYKNNNTWSWYFDENGNLGVGTVPWGNVSGRPSTLSTGSAGALRISTGTGYADIGSQNGGYFHFQTDRPNFYMNKSLNVDGEIRVYNSSTYLNSGGGYIAGNTIVHTGNVASYVNKWYDGWVGSPGYDANTIGASKSGFSYSNNCPNTGCLVHFDAGGYGLQLSSVYYSNGNLIYPWCWYRCLYCRGSVPLFCQYCLWIFTLSPNSKTNR